MPVCLRNLFFMFSPRYRLFFFIWGTKLAWLCQITILMPYPYIHACLSALYIGYKTNTILGLLHPTRLYQGKRPVQRYTTSYQVSNKENRPQKLLQKTLKLTPSYVSKIYHQLIGFSDEKNEHNCWCRNFKNVFKKYLSVSTWVPKLTKKI